MSTFKEKISIALEERFGLKNLGVLTGKAIVAGSFPLQVELGEHWNGSDMDVYSHIQNVFSVVNVFLAQGYTRVPHKDVVVGTYAGAGFLNRNKIKGFVSLAKPGFADVQVMAVRQSILLRDVVANFDLSCCSISWDFSSEDAQFRGVTRQDIHLRQGFVRESYASLYYHVNLVTHGRIEKYILRGFTITPPSLSCYLAAVKEKREKEEKAFWEDPFWRSKYEVDHIKYYDKIKRKEHLRKAYKEKNIEPLSYDSDAELKNK